jgi:hypothetical protein
MYHQASVLLRFVVEYYRMIGLPASDVIDATRDPSFRCVSVYPSALRNVKESALSKLKLISCRYAINVSLYKMNG